MTVLIAVNQTAGALAITQLSVPDREIPGSGQVTLTDWNTLNEIQDDEELLSYVNDGYVLIDRDGVLLDQADSVYALTTAVLIEDGYELATKSYVDGYVNTQISLIDHGNLLGLGDDDHIQYSLVDGSRAFTNPVSGITPTDAAHLATKGYVDGYIDLNNEWSEVLANGNTTGGTDPVISSGDAIKGETDLYLEAIDGYIIFERSAVEVARFHDLSGNPTLQFDDHGDAIIGFGSLPVSGPSAALTISAQSSSDSTAGDLTLYTGNGTIAGYIDIHTGASSAGTGPDLELTAGNGSTGLGGSVILTSGGISVGGSGDGGNIKLSASFGRGAGNVGGNIILTTGEGLENATDGYIIFKRASIEVARFNENNFLDVNANRIVDVQDPVDPQDAATKAYVDGYVYDHGELAGLNDDDHTQYLLVSGTRAMTGDLNLDSHSITNVTDPSDPQDAATKNYVDGYIDANNEWSEVLANGNTTEGYNPIISTGDQIEGETDLTLVSGNTQGNINLTTAASTGGRIGNITLRTGGPAGGAGPGTITLQTGENTAGGGADISLLGGFTQNSTGDAGNIHLQGGSHNNGAGAVVQAQGGISIAGGGNLLLTSGDGYTTRNAGDVVVTAGVAEGTGTDGYIIFNHGSSEVARFYENALQFDSALSSVGIRQAKTTVGDGASITITAQSTSGLSSDGGNIRLVSGGGGGGAPAGIDGYIEFWIGTGADTAVKVAEFSGTTLALDVQANPITNVENPTNPQDAATKNYVDGYTIDLFDLTYEPSGFPNTTDSTISVVPGTRTFTIQPTASSYEVLFKGRIITKTGAENVVWTDVEGLHFFYFDSDAVLQHSVLESDAINAIYGDGNFISALYWNATDGYVEFWAEERHGFMPGPTHAHFHLAFGAQWVSGGALGNLNAGGSGDDDTSAQFSVGTVTIRDEDLSFTWSDGSPQEMSPIAEIPIYYRSGASGDWRKKPSDQFNIIYSGTAGYVGANGRAAYNEYTGATWQLTQLGEGKYVLVHYYATDEINEPIIGILGQNEYSSAAEATAGAENEINDLQGTADLLALEHVALATTIWESKASFGNTPTARIVQTTDGFDYIDWRGSTRRGTGGVSGETVHANLSGLLEDDHTQYLLVDGTRAMGGNLDMDGYYIVDLADPVNPQDAATKNYVDGYVFSELAALEHGDLLGLGDDDHTQYLLVNGTRAMTGNLDMDNTYTVINLIDPTNPQDAVTKGYVDGYFFNLDHSDLNGLGDDDHTQYLLVNGTRAMTGDLDLDNTYNVVNSVDPTNPQDAATKNYVDGYIHDYLPLDGSRAMTGNLDLGSNDITNPGINTFSTIYGAATDGNRGDILYRGDTNWVRLSPSTDGYVLTTRGAGDDPEWYPAPGASGGEANIGSNLGTDGYGVYDSKSSVTLRFRNIAVVSNILTINYDATDHDIDIGVNQANIDHGSIGGLADDDHTQYILVNGTRAFTGPVQGDTDLTLIAQDGYVTLNSDMDADGYDIINIDVATNDAEYSMGNQSTSITLDANNGNFQTFNLNGNITSVTMTPPLTGIGRFQVRIVQNASYTITGWPASVLWPGGTDPTITTGASSIDIITFFWNGTNWYGIWGGDFS